jgi:hypothetical protein
MTKKEQLLKVRALECLERLRKVIELNAPPLIIGDFAFSLYATVLAAYGEHAGEGLIRHLREQNLQSRALCHYGDCTNGVERTPFGICADCQKEIGCDDESMKKYDLEANDLGIEHQ